MTTIRTSTTCAPAQHRAQHQAQRRTLRPIAWIKLVFSIRQQRLALKALDTDQLRDVGLTRIQANDEANLPVWDVPDHWRLK